jgi:hypothetical protein
VSEEQSAQAPPACDSPADQQACEAAVFIAADLFTFALVPFFFVGAAFIHAVAEQMGQQQATHAAPAKHPFRGQEAYQTVLLIAAAFLSGFVFISLVLAAAFLPEQVRQQQAAQAATAQSSTNQQTGEPMLLVVSFATFGIVIGLLE